MTVNATAITLVAVVVSYEGPICHQDAKIARFHIAMKLSFPRGGMTVSKPTRVSPVYAA